MFRTQVILIAASLLALTLVSCSAPSKVGCESDVQCRDGRICLDGKCEASGGANNMTPNNVTPNNVTPNNVTPNNVTPNNVTPNNVTPNNVTPNNSNPDVELCERFCDKLLGSCVDQECDVTPQLRSALDGLFEYCMFIGFDEGEPGCVDALAQEPDLAGELEVFISSLDCGGPELQEFRCTELDLGDACGCPPTAFAGIGERCVDARDCDGGGLPGACFDESNPPGFPDGYCVSFGCPLRPDEPGPHYDDLCGAGNVCAPGGDGSMTGICVAGCDQHAGCRDQYQCRLVGAQNLVPIRICLPECGSDVDCGGENERCADGHCQLECTAQGEPSGRAICEALGFECSPDDAGIQWCIMP